MRKIYRKKEFNFLMNNRDKKNQSVEDCLVKAGSDKWKRVYASVHRGRMVTFDITQCINGKLVKEIELPILEILKQARILFES